MLTCARLPSTSVRQPDRQDSIRLPGWPRQLAAERRARYQTRPHARSSVAARRVAPSRKALAADL